MGLGIITLLLAMGAAGWLLYQTAQQNRESGGTGSAAQNRLKVTILKLVIWLSLCATLFAIKLWPLALMALLAAGAITAIELWKQQTIDQMENEARRDQFGNHRAGSVSGPMTKKEAYQLLGLEQGASADMIRAAHKKLIAQLHPDHGGTDYLAAKINNAREVLLQDLKILQADQE